MSCGFGIDSFLNSLIIGHLLSNGYRSESVQAYFPTYSEAQLSWDSMMSFVAFHAGGVVAGMVNVLCARYPEDKKRGTTGSFEMGLSLARDLLIWISLIIWLAGHVAIGYYGYTEADWISPGGDPHTARLQEDRNIIFVMISAFGGYFYWGTFGISLATYRNWGNAVIPAIAIDLIAVPVFALILNVIFRSILTPAGAYLYSYRLIPLPAGVMVIVRLAMTQKDKDDETIQSDTVLPEASSLVGRKTREKVDSKSSWIVTGLHMISLTVQMTYLYIPTIIIPRIADDSYGALNLLFGGMAVGAFLGSVSLIVAHQREFFIHILDLLGVLSTMTLLIMFCSWGNIDDNISAFAVCYGISVGILQASNFHRGIFKHVAAVNWGVACSAAALIGTGVGTLFVNANWTLSRAPEEVIGLSATAFCVSGVSIFLNLYWHKI